MRSSKRTDFFYGLSLVYFPESLSQTSQVEILGEKELDRWLKKG